MRNIVFTIFIAVILIAGFQMCFGDDPQLSITKSNQSVILTWPLTADTNWVLATTSLDPPFESNGVVYILAKHIYPSNRYSTNGTNLFIVLPVDYSGNTFYTLLTNNFPTLTPPTNIFPTLNPPQTGS